MALNEKVLKGWPPGGWSFYEPATDWHAPLPLANNFDQQSDNIWAMRKANPHAKLSADRAAAAADLELYTEARLRRIYSRHGLAAFLAPATEDVVKKKPNAATAPAAAPPTESSFITHASNARKELAALAAADPTALLEWLGDGGVPVNGALANERALVCVACPGNRKGDWRNLLTAPAAAAVLRYLRWKDGWSLSTPFDSDLGVCRGCLCQLQLKVHVPLPCIAEGTSGETRGKLAALNPACWIITEAPAAAAAPMPTPPITVP